MTFLRIWLFANMTCLIQAKISVLVGEPAKRSEGVDVNLAVDDPEQVACRHSPYRADGGLDRQPCHVGDVLASMIDPSGTIAVQFGHYGNENACYPLFG